MKRKILRRPQVLSIFVALVLLVIGGFLFRSDDAAPAPQDPEPEAQESPLIAGAQPATSHSCQGGCHPEQDPTTANQAGSASDELREERRATAGAGQPLSANFLDQAVQGRIIRFTLPDDTSVVGKILHIEHDEDGVLAVAARIDRPSPGRLLIQRQTTPGVAGPFFGHILFDDRNAGWKIEPTGDRSAARFVPRPDGAIICVGIGHPPEKPQQAAAPQAAPQDHPSDIPLADGQTIIPLESLPGATGVLYLDFDGEKGPFPSWFLTDVDALPSTAGNTEIFEIWRRVSEDFLGFNLNVTTDRAVFDATPAGRRQQIIITPTSDAKPGSGGVAYIGTFNSTTPSPAWAFLQTGKSAAEVISHELGHTLGLGHHGSTSPPDEYYGGHGTGEVGWAPIMGTPYTKNLTQWSKGEYLNANKSSQDDLAIIALGNNDVGYRIDDYGSTLGSAGYLEIFADDSIDNQGIIERSGDVDAFRFETSGGPISLAIDPASLGANLDIHAEIVEAGTLAPVVEINPPDRIDATLSATLAAGEYLLRIRGSGRSGSGLGDPPDDGYTDYGSLGSYLISGSIQGGVTPLRFDLAEHSANGTHIGTVEPRNAHGGAPLSFTFASGNTDGVFALDETTGALTVANASLLDYETLSLRWDDPTVIVPFVRITNASEPALNETIRVVVNIIDINEPPTVSAASFTMAERTASGTLLPAAASGSDPDRFQTVRYSIAAGNADGAFQIDPGSGALTAAEPFEVAHTLTRELTIAATDTHDPGLTTTTVIEVTVVDHQLASAPGSITRSFYENITGSSVLSLTSAPAFPDEPDLVIPLADFDGGGHGEDFGSTVRGYLIVPATGDYQFHIASDENGALLFAANGDAAAATQIASVPGRTDRYQWDAYADQLSAVFALQEGQICYIEARHKEAGGDDHVAVAWTGPGIASPQVIPGRFLGPFNQNYPPKIPSATLTIRENAIVGQSVGIVSASDPVPDESFTQFEILGGNGQDIFSIHPATGRVTVDAPLNIAQSPLTLTVGVSDGGTPPLSGQGNLTIEITPADSIKISDVVQQIWEDLPGSALTDLTNAPAYPWSPSSTRMLTNGFDTGTNLGSDYGSRIRALVTPPTTGEYTFFLSTDDNGQLLMSDDAASAGATVIAEVNDWAPPNDWTKFPTQTSAPRQLTGGQSYYIETLHKEGSGGDHVQVAWTGPGIATPTIISDSALHPFNINAPPVFEPAGYTFNLDASLPIGTELASLSVNDPEGEPVVIAVTDGNQAGNFAVSADGRLIFADKLNLFNGITELTVTAQDAGLDGAYPLMSATARVTIHVTNAQDPHLPAPDPMAWSRPPTATSNTTIEMEATQAFGTGGIEYFFECLMPDGQSSGWQESPIYTDTGLTPGGTYVYRVKARDKSPEANETGWSAHASATLRSRPNITGGEVAVVGDSITHTFRAGGDAQLTLLGAGGTVEVDVLIVGGGGSGASSSTLDGAGAGGGGAGGVVYREDLLIHQSTPVTVGQGGVPYGSIGNFNGRDGENSSFGDLVALGGGGGGSMRGRPGGSGGGGRRNAGGTGLQPTAETPGFGNDGSIWQASGGDGAAGGGGAGAPAPGPGTTAQVGGPGGAGLAFDISGTATDYAGGGGGGAARLTAVGVGGNGGGGNGANDGTPPIAGVAGTGGGGGGGNDSHIGAPGGSGIVIVRYPVEEPGDFQNWATQWPELDLEDPAADFSRDGMTDHDKYIWGLDPTDATALQPIRTLPDPTSLSFTYTRRRASRTGRVFSVWISTDLVSWKRDDAIVQTVSTSEANDLEVVTVTLPSDTSRERIFVKVLAE